MAGAVDRVVLVALLAHAGVSRRVQHHVGLSAGNYVAGLGGFIVELVGQAETGVGDCSRAEL